MAEIAIEKKNQGTPWWLWVILAVLVIGGLIWYFTSRGDGTQARNRTEATTETSGAAVTDMSVLYNVSSQSDYVGRAVSSQPVRVLSVTGDRTFWVGDGIGRQALVLVNQQATPGQPATEGRYDVNSGQMVRVHGHVERFPGFAEAQRMWNVPDSTKAQLQDQKIYIVADSLDITQRP